jgi:membrane dipeptidase
MAQDFVSLEEELRYIEIFFQFGCRMMHLTYNRRNLIGDGCAEPADAGLSDFGRAVIAEMNRVGVIVDVAHSGLKTSLEAAGVSARPMVASHSVARSVNNHIRGKSDEVIRAIADTGGYVGICAIPAFLGGSGDISAFLDHIEYVAKKFGPEHVAIGMDRAYASMQADVEYNKIPKRRAVRSPWVSFWPKDEPLFSSEWNKPEHQMSLEWTNWPLFTVGLVQRGFSDEDIKKIIGGNVLRVAEDVLTTG